MATQLSAWTGEKPRKAGNGADRGSAARSGEKVISISHIGSAQEVRTYGSQSRDVNLTTLARTPGSCLQSEAGNYLGSLVKNL